MLYHVPLPASEFHLKLWQTTFFMLKPTHLSASLLFHLQAVSDTRGACCRCIRRANIPALLSIQSDNPKTCSTWFLSDHLYITVLCSDFSPFLLIFPTPSHVLPGISSSVNNMLQSLTQVGFGKTQN